jgi:hypothetical protein
MSNGDRSFSCLPRLAVAFTLILLAAVAVWLVATRGIAGPDHARFSEGRPSGSVRVGVPPGSILPARQWPTTCQLLTDDQILSVLPDATEIDELPGGVSTRTIDAFAADPSWQEGDYAPEGRCVWHMKLPGERINALTFVSIRIVAVADPELIRRYHDDQNLGRGAGQPASGDANCYLSSLYDAHLVCAHGPVMFEVGGSTTTDFGDYRAYSFWRDSVLPELAAIVASKLPAG